MQFFSKILIGVLCIICSYAFAEANNSNPLSNTLLIYTPEKINWLEGPKSLPQGVKMAVLEGDPKSEGPFTIRLKFPANYRLMPNTNSGPEHITVISGNIFLGYGDKFDEKTSIRIEPSSFVLIRPNTAHFGYTQEEAVIQLHGMGPWNMNYINPKDDPRRKN